MSDKSAINKIQEIARSTGRNPAQVIKEALKETQGSNIDPNRPLKQKTCDMYLDQYDEINERAKATGLTAAVVLRNALDKGLGLPKGKK